MYTNVTLRCCDLLFKMPKLLKLAFWHFHIFLKCENQLEIVTSDISFNSVNP